MIKINKQECPDILVKYQEIWTEDLMNSVNKYGSYKNIPNEEKNKLICHYKHNDIKESLFNSSHNKCAYCECKPAEGGNIEVEHIKPKSLYPDLTFCWDNMLPSCRKCNEAKRDFDTGKNPIINPAKEDPEKLLTYHLCHIIPVPVSAEIDKAKNTIACCNLNSTRLYKKRSDLITTMAGYIDELAIKLQNIKTESDENKRNKLIVQLRNSLEMVDLNLKDDALYSGYWRWLVSQHQEYEEAKCIVSEWESTKDV